ncbi:MAG: HAD family hydrolase [Bacteroidota bacterium]
MNIQALIFDLDGTAIPSRIDGMPSQVVIDAVRKAKKICHVSVATGRPYSYAKDILEALKIDDLCILNGGSSLYSCKTNEYVWKQEMDIHLLEEVVFKLKAFHAHDVEDDSLRGKVKLSDYHPKGPICLTCIFSVNHAESEEIIDIVKKTSGLIAHAMNSHTLGMYDVHITHELATKKHALQSLLARLNVDHTHVMVVGDGGNDVPLFELAGIKVAMGNGAEKLKELADWIAPGVDDDGLAVAIEKFILTK